MALNGGGAAGLGIELSASDAMSPTLDKANESVSRLHEGLMHMGSTVDAVSAKIAGIGKALYDAGKGFLEGAFDLAKTSGGPFEAAMHDVQFFTNASASDMDDLTHAVTTSRNALMGFSAIDSAKAMKELSQLTGNATDALNEFEPALLLAGIGGKSTEAAVDSLQKTLHTFRLGSADAGEVVDQLAVTSQLFHIKVGGLADALNRAGDGAKNMRMSAADTMLVIGLMGAKTNDLAKVASQANMAMTQFANPKAQAAIKALGVETKDTAGNLRNFPDILGQIADKYTPLQETQIHDTLVKATNRKAAGELLAVIKDLSKGVVDQTGHLRTGSEAIKYYAEQQNKSAEAAKKMNEALLDTFEGQEKVMTASISSLKTAIAGPLAGAFKPIISAASEGIRSITDFLNDMDAGSKKAMATMALVGGAIVTVLGAAFIFLGGPATLAIGALIAAGAGLYAAYKMNLGGLADWVHETWDKVSLVFKSLASLLSGDSMSIDLFEKLNKHPGLRNFVMNVYVWVNRAKHFFGGLVDGFQDGLKRLQPVFDALSEAVTKVMHHFGGLTDAIDPRSNKDAFRRAGESGKSLGDTLADLVGDIAKVVTAIADMADGFMNGWHIIASATKGLGDDFSSLGEAVFSLIGAFTGADDASSSASVSFSDLGNAIAGALGSAIQDAKDNIHSIIGLIRSIAHVFSGVIKTIDGLATGNWNKVWDGMKETVYGLVSAVLSAFETMNVGVAKGMDSLASLAGKTTHYAADARAGYADMNDELKKSMNIDQPSHKSDKESYSQQHAGEPDKGKFADWGQQFGPPTAAVAAAADNTAGAQLVGSLNSAFSRLVAAQKPGTLTAHITVNVDKDGNSEHDRLGVPIHHGD